MITLISTVVSFLLGNTPKILDFFQDKADKKHEIELAQMQMDQQMRLQAAGFASQEHIEEIHIEQSKIEAGVKIQEIALTERQALLQHDTESSVGASQWVINARAMVRPTITYGMFLLLVFVDVFGFIYAFQTSVNFKDALTVLWNADSQQIFAIVIAFYFGSRDSKK